MNYALIENGIVANVIWLYKGNASDFPEAVAINDLPVGIGDTYTDGKFFRNGQEIVTEAEERLLAELNAAYVEGVNSI